MCPRVWLGARFPVSASATQFYFNCVIETFYGLLDLEGGSPKLPEAVYLKAPSMFSV